MTTRAEISELANEIVFLSQRLATGTYDLLKLVCRALNTGAWALDGSLSCHAWLAELTEVEISTARAQVRVAQALNDYPELRAAMESGDISYAKSRVLVSHLNEHNLESLIALAASTPARDLAKAIARWSHHNEDQQTIDDRQYQARSVSWRTEADGMVTITARLQPAVAAALCAVIDQTVMRSDAPAGATLAQQRADALSTVATDGGGTVDTEIVVHVREDGCTLRDGTPLTDHAVGALLPDSFVSLLMHDSQRLPIDASPRRRFPTRRQRRVLDERSACCEAPGCTSTVFLQYDHLQPYSQGGQTVLANLQRLCGPHNRAKENRAASIK